MGYRAFSFEIQPFLPQTPKQVGMDCELLTFERAEAVVNTNVFLNMLQGEEGKFFFIKIDATSESS